MKNNTTYKFGNMSLTGDQFEELKQIAQLGEMGLLGDNGMDMFTQTLMRKPSMLDQALQEFMGGGASQDAGFNGSITPGGSVQGEDFFASPATARKLGMIAPEQQPNPNVLGMQGEQPQQEGTFGFGNAPGQLFGKGGLFHGVVDPLVNATVTGIVNPAAAIAGTGLNVLRETGQGKTLEQALASPDSALERQAPLITGKFGMNEMDLGENFNEYINDPLRGGLKQGATLLSYAAPAKVPVASQVANPILRAGLTGATQGLASGGLMGFGQSEAGKELEGAGSGAAIGGLAGGALGLAGGAVGQLLNKLGANKGGTVAQTSVLDKFNEAIKKGGMEKKLGATGTMGDINPALNYLNSGSAQIDDAFAKAGITLSPAEKAQLAREVLTRGGDRVPEILKTQLQSLTGGVDDAARLTPQDRLTDMLTDPKDIPTDDFGRPLTEGNILQKAGRAADFENLNFKAKPGTNMYDEQIKAQVLHDRAARALGVNLDAKGIQTIHDEVVSARNNLLNNAGIAPADMSSLQTNMADDFLNTFGAGSAKAGNTLPIDKVRGFLEDNITPELLRDLGYGNVDEGFLNSMVQGKVPVTPKVAQALRDRVQKQALSAGRKIYGASNAPLTADEQIAHVVDEGLKKYLYEVPGYRDANTILAAQANRAGDLAAGFNAGNMVSSQGRINPLEIASRQGLKGVGKVANTVGDLLAGESVGVPQVLQNAVKPVAGALSGVAKAGTGPTADLIARIASGAIPLGLAGNNARGGSTLPGMEDVLGSSSSIGQMGTGGGNTDREGNLRRAMAMAVMSGELDPSQASSTLELLGLGGSKMTAGQQDKVANLDTQVESLGMIEQLIRDNASEFGAGNVMGRIRDSLGGIATDPNRAAIKTQIQFEVSQLLNSLSGAGASDKERQVVAKMLPDLDQDSAEVALAKLGKVKDRVALQRKNLGRGQTSGMGGNSSVLAMLGM